MGRYGFYGLFKGSCGKTGNICRFLPLLVLGAVLLSVGIGISAQTRQTTQAPHARQTDLTGLVFGNPDISWLTPEQLVADINGKLSGKEKELGRKLTEAEKEKLAEVFANDMIGIKGLQLISAISVTVKFLPDSKAEMKMTAELREDLLKEVGISWIQRKSMKAMISMVSNTVKDKYVRKGDLIIISPGKEPDTLRLSADGRKLYGKIEEGFPFTLTLRPTK